MFLAFADIGSHAHGGDNFGIAQATTDLGTDPVGLTICILHLLAGDNFVGVGQRHHDNAGNYCRHPKPGMKHEHYCHINRKPGRIKESKQPIAGEELAQTGQITQGLGVTNHAAREQGALKGGVGDSLAQVVLDTITGADENHRTHPFKTTGGSQ